MIMPPGIIVVHLCGMENHQKLPWLWLTCVIVQPPLIYRWFTFHDPFVTFTSNISKFELKLLILF